MARGSMGANDGVTPHRKTRLRLDVAESFLVEFPFTRSWALDQLARGPKSKATNVHFLPQVGWELQPYQVRESNTRERTEAASGVHKTVGDGGSLQVQAGGGWQGGFQFRSPTDLTGATTGASANLATQGDYFVERAVGASASWADHELAADATAFPKPVAANMEPVPDTGSFYDDTLATDRVAAGTQPVANDVGTIFRFQVPGTGIQAASIVARYYFSGPAGYHAQLYGPDAVTEAKRRAGTGQYCVEFRGDGTAKLFEKNVFGSWLQLRDDATFFRYAPRNMVSGHTHTIYIRSVKRQAVKGAYMIVFQMAHTRDTGMRGFQQQGQPNYTEVFVYRVPLPGNAPPPADVPTPPRVDVRRDQKPKFQISEARYPLSGTLRCDPFAVPFYPTNAAVLRVVFLYDAPAGCTVTCAAYDEATGTALTPYGTAGANHRDFTIAFGQYSFYVVFTLTGNGTHSPMLYGYRVQRNGRLETSSPTTETVASFTAHGGSTSNNLVQQALTDIQVATAEGDPNRDTGSVTVSDVTMASTILKSRGRATFVLDTLYNPADLTSWAVLARGYAMRPKGVRKGRARREGRTATAASYPHARWQQYRVQLVGEWMRLQEQFSNVRWNWHWPDLESAVGAPYKATDAIRTMLNWCGFLASDIDVPNLDVRLWPTDNEMDLFIEPGAPLIDYIAKIARDYLGGWIAFDPNAGVRGMWRLLMPNRPPYTRLLRLREAPPSGGGTRVLAGVLPSYPDYVDADGQGNTIRCTPVYKHERTIVPPEANAVLVTGLALGDYTGVPKRLTQWAVNPLSYNFYNGANTADPTHRDYLGTAVPIFVIDPGLNTPEAVNWAVRRVYDIACHGTFMDTCECALQFVTDPNDAEQLTPRLPRYYDPIVWRDPVLDNGTATKTWLVRSCSAAYKNDRNQRMTLEVQYPNPPYEE